MTTLPWCSDQCRRNGGWLLHAETGMPTGRCRCRLPAEMVAAADQAATVEREAARARQARYDAETVTEEGESAC